MGVFGGILKATIAMSTNTGCPPTNADDYCRSLEWQVLCGLANMPDLWQVDVMLFIACWKEYARRTQ